MRSIGVLLIVVLVGSLLFFIFWVLWRILRNGENKSSLFGGGFPVFFKGIIKKLNPFLIVKKKKDIELNVPKTSSENKGIIKIQQKSKKGSGGEVTPLPESKKVGKERKPKKDFKSSSKKKHISRSGFLIKINDLKELSKRLKNKDLAYVFEFLKKENYSLLEKMFLGKKFKSQEEFIEYFKEEFVRFLNSEVTLLKGRISYLRKNGKDVSGLDFKIMAIPLKVRLFSATFSKKDFDKVLSLLKEADEELKIKEIELKKEN